LTIGDGLRVIQNSSFSDCSSLQNITFGQSINIIKYNAFRDCVSLVELTFNDYLYQIDGGAANVISGAPSSGAFSGCTNLRRVTFGEFLRYLAGTVFEGCFLLEEANFKGSPPVVDTNPFQSSPTTVYTDTNATGWGGNFSYRPVFRKTLIITPPAASSALLDIYSSTDLSTWTLMESIEVVNPPEQIFMKAVLTPPSE